MSFLVVSALGPLPQAFVNLVVNSAEYLRGYDKPLIVYPAANDRIEFADKQFLINGFLAFDDAPYFLKKRPNGGF